MGQYHKVMNLDKKQYLMPHRLGDGLKLMEFGNSAGGVMTGLAILLAVSNGRGGGDLNADDHEFAPLVGSWGGDRIAIVGDYAEPTDLAPEFEAATIYERCAEDGDYIDISAGVRALIEADGIFTFGPDDGSWIDRTSRFERPV